MIRILLLCILYTLTSVAASSQDRRPLLLEGKTTLYQKVLTRPGASIAEGPGGPGTQPLLPFTPLYVYQRHPVDGGGGTYLEVGPDARGAVSGFLPEMAVVPWNHALVLAFTDRGKRDRVLFLNDEAALDGWLQDPNLTLRAQQARVAIDAGTAAENGDVISIEPEAYVDFSNQFYMLPVLEANRKRLPGRQRAMAVRIASVTKEKTGKLQLLNRRQNAAGFGDFRAGVVFVIDASSSMQPYISRTREAMRGVLERVADESLSDKVRFGVVGYRDDPAAVQGIEYLTRTFADPNQIEGTTDFQAAVAPLSASKVSTRAFSEDAFAAIDHAIGRIDWTGFDARYLVLITDASARDASSPFAALKLNAADMRNDIRGRSGSLPTAIYALHLKTPVGRDDHAKAEAQYTELTRLDSGRSLYYPVESGDPAAFQRKVSALADALVAQVRQTSAAKSAADLARAPAPPARKDGEEDIRAGAAEVGRAMALAWLGKQEGAQAPAMFEAWASDRDFANPTVPAFSVRLLMSKNQMSDLQRTMTATVEALDAGQIDPSDFFNQLRSAATAMGRDPNRVGQGAARNLAASGLIGEYLERLPYQSRIMSLTEDDWVRMSVGEQQGIIDDVTSKLRLYQRYHDDADRWIALNEGADPGDWVYPVPLDALP